MSTAPSHAQEVPDLSGVQVTPARVEQDQSGREIDEVVRFVNEEPVEQTIAVSLSGLGHELDGAALFPIDEGIQSSLEASGVGSFVLQPGARHEVRVRGLIPAGRPALYASVVAEFAPTGQDPSANVSARVQLASVFLVRGPRPWQESVHVRDAGFLSEDAEGAYTVFADVENTGNVHQYPSGTVTVRDSAGQHLAELPLEEELILPGYARRLTATWMPPSDLTPGPLELDVAIRNPDATGVVRADYPPDLKLDFRVDSLTARRDENGQPVVDATVRNQGAEALTLTGSLSLSEGPAGLSAGPFRSDPVVSLAPGDTATMVTRIEDGIPPGPWEARLTVAGHGLEKAVEATIVFPGAAGESSEPVDANEVPLHRDRNVLIPLALGLIILMLLLLFLFWWFVWRRRKEDEDEDQRDAPKKRREKLLSRK